MARDVLDFREFNGETVVPGVPETEKGDRVAVVGGGKGRVEGILAGRNVVGEVVKGFGESLPDGGVAVECDGKVEAEPVQGCVCGG